MLPGRVAELRTRMTRAALSICRKYGHWERACHRSASSPAPRHPITLCDDQSVGETIVLLANDLQQEELERAGWHVSARSFGAQLDVDRIDSEGLARLVTRAGPAIRELRADDVDAILTLDAATSGDYPGGVATRHDPLTPHSAAASDSRRAFGAFLADGELVAMTFVDVHGATAETDFTVVHPDWRRRGVATAVKAASILALSSEAVTRFRTGGSADNAAILRANATLGYVRDEEWVTLTRGSA